MTDAELLTKVKTGLFGNAQGNWRDDMLSVYVGEVLEFMKDAGVSEIVATSDAAVGCIMMGVSDLWNYNSGGVKFSDYFIKRVIQLAAVTGSDGA